VIGGTWEGWRFSYLCPIEDAGVQVEKYQSRICFGQRHTSFKSASELKVTLKVKMANATQFIGSKISLISKSEIRYDGILYSLDVKESTISLAKGKVI
jgi:hypothetical protein